MAHTRAQADRLADALRGLPAAEPRRQFNNREMVMYLAAEIIGLQERGYSMEKIAAAPRAGGLEITEPTLKTYLSRMKTKSPRSEAEDPSWSCTGRAGHPHHRASSQLIPHWAEMVAA